MKKFAAILLAVFACLFAFACTETGGGDDPGDNPGGNGGGNEPVENPLKDNTGMIDTKYDLKTYLYPIWEGRAVYNETLWFAPDNVAPLLYKPEEILSVRSYDLKTTYVENVDYIVDGSSLVLPAGSSIPRMSYEEFYPATVGINMIPVESRSQAGRYLFAMEGDTISRRQVVVSYIHREEKNWTLPRNDSARFPKTMQKLASGEPIKVVFYGDSITVGANSSEFLKIDPKAESYANIVKSYINKRFPTANMTFVNNAVGGTDSNWGAGKLTGIPAIDDIFVPEGTRADHFKIRVLDEKPDLLFIAYGMNDQNYGAENYAANIVEMCQRIRAQNPNVEIMLISGMIANPDTGFDNKNYEAYQQALVATADDIYKGEGVGVSTVLNTVRSLYANGKRFQDCTANNVNHPNDFMMRVYAQTVLYSLFGPDYIEHI